MAGKKKSGIAIVVAVKPVSKKKKGMCSDCAHEFEEGERFEGDKLKNRNKKITKVMSEFGDGELHSGSKKGPKVKSRKQALAIGYAESKKSFKKKKKK